MYELVCLFLVCSAIDVVFESGVFVSLIAAIASIFDD